MVKCYGSEGFSRDFTLNRPLAIASLEKGDLDNTLTAQLAKKTASLSRSVCLLQFKLIIKSLLVPLVHGVYTSLEKEDMTAVDCTEKVFPTSPQN